jgi:osmotically-inducible protein OsmY
MGRRLLAFLLGVLVGAAGYWYLERTRRADRLEQAGARVAAGAERIKQSMQDRFKGLGIQEIREELTRTGMVVREKAQRAGAAIADAAADTRITAAIKGKLLADPELSAWSIDVTTTDGLVTLAGTVSSEQEVAKAVRLALETEGARKVVSTLQVKP